MISIDSWLQMIQFSISIHLVSYIFIVLIPHLLISLRKACDNDSFVTRVKQPHHHTDHLLESSEQKSIWWFKVQISKGFTGLVWSEVSLVSTLIKLFIQLIRTTSLINRISKNTFLPSVASENFTHLQYSSEEMDAQIPIDILQLLYVRMRLN